ncbi:MAG: fumarate hydratase C-terminal domain-containing protein, partial [Syntrophobacteria bacterium]
MSYAIRLMPPLTDADVEGLQIGDRVLISGAIYTGRDAAHKRLTDLIQAGKPLP